MSTSSKSNWGATSMENLAVENFRNYLRIPSVHPNINYGACVSFFENLAKNLDLPMHVVECIPGKPVVILTWLGREPDLPSILLNSHMDVVPVFDDWSHKPFNADIDDQGNIYARGAQDMKCVGIQYLEAIRKMKSEGTTLKRTVHVLFVPDEEIGGVEGMRAFVNTRDFQDLNIGFALDEGCPTNTDDFLIFYGERSICQMCIHCPGQPGHGSLMLDNTAGEKASYILQKIFEFRAQEKKKIIRLECNPSLEVGDVTSINLTQMQGGLQANVIPPEFTLILDCRVSASMNLKKWEETIDQWCKEAGDGVKVEYINKEPQTAVTKLDGSNPYWTAFKDTAEKLNMKLVPIICPAVTDVRYIRNLGIPGIGFSPMNNTESRFHREDEYLNVNTFLTGINIYCKLIAAVANV